MSCSCGGDSERGGEVRLAGSGWAEQHDVAGLGQESSRCERGDLLSARGLGIEVEVLECFDSTESGGTDPQLRARRVTRADFAFKDRRQVVLMCPARVTRLIGESGGSLGDPGRLQRSREIDDLLDRLAARRTCHVLGGGHQTIPPV